jgi:ABC-type nitrate/sulfonate/bicarbonate transport system permease component
MKRLIVFGTRYLRFAGLPIFLIIWQLVVWLKIIDPVLLPGPGPTFAALWHGLTTGGPLAHDFGRTVSRVLQAILIAIVIGVPVGVLLGVSEKIYRSIEFIVDFFRSTPTSALFPLFLLIFGVGDQSKVYISAFAAGLVIVFNTAYGVMNARKTRVLAARVMGARPFDRMVVILLESLPQNFIGLRSGASLALVIMISAEMLIGSTDGLGLRVFEEQQRFDMPAMYAGIFTAGALGYGFNLVLQLVEKRFVHWAGK